MKTVEEFRSQLYAKFGERLIIPQDAIYLGNKKDIKVICPKHGIKWMRPNNLLSGAKCKDCGYIDVSNANRDTVEQFLEKTRRRHKEDYEYPNIYEEYGNYQKIHIKCKKCGRIFEQRPALHVFGNGCPTCHPFPQKHTTETLIERIHEKHPNIDLIGEYIGDNDSEVTVKCKTHNIEWKTTPHRLLQQKHGCEKCYQEERKKTMNEIQAKKFQKFLEIHYQPLYDTSKVNYIDNKTKVTLICQIHGEFSLRPDKMISRLDGCPYCNESHLERNVRIILDNLGIQYEREKRFEWLFNKTKMSLDFYLPEYNIAIECQGEQHVIDRDSSLMNKYDKFEDKVSRDMLKLKQCKENNLPIAYIFKKINSSDMLNEQFNHMYDDALFIEDILEDNCILLDRIRKLSETH